MKQLYILDDEPEYLELLSEVAKQCGWTVNTEHDSLKFLRGGVPADGVLVLDLVMPNQDGIEIIQRLAAEDTQLGLILISGFDHRILESARLLAQAKKITVHAALEKPFDMSLFRQALAKVEESLAG
jgi:FixJ family two-component response regulator